MRVIAGKAKSLPLKSLDGYETRPTTDRIKETLFNMIASEIPDSRFLDLFSGSGAIAIEALSRGASMAVLVEQNHNACRIIRENLMFTKLTDAATVLEENVLSAIDHLKDPFDIIFMDPPYDQALEEQVLRIASKSTLVADRTLIIVEASLQTRFDYLSDIGFEIIREKKYKTNQHVFIRRI